VEDEEEEEERIFMVHQLSPSYSSSVGASLTNGITVRRYSTV